MSLIVAARRARRGLRPLGIAIALLAAGCASETRQEMPLYRAPAIPDTVDGVVFEAGNWEPHLAAGDEGTSWGKHRAVVVLDDQTAAAAAQAGAVAVTIPWRRHDSDPAGKSVVVLDAATGEPLSNVIAARVENVSGDVVFQPVAGSSEYHVYYMPWQSTGGYYPTVTYPELAPEPDPGWVAAVNGSAAGDAAASGQAAASAALGQAEAAMAAVARLPRARVTAIQSVNDFHSFFPMELIATPDEYAAFMAGAEQGWAVMSEHRDYPVRMRRFIPQHWAGGDDQAGGPARHSFTSRVLRGESFTFQVAVVTGEESLDDVEVGFSYFAPGWDWTCFNCGGIDRTGAQFEKEIYVPAATVQPLWLGVQVPEDQPPGRVTGTVTVVSANRGSKTIDVTLEVLDGDARNGGTDEPDLMTRLAWLNSTVGSDPDIVVPPFESVETQVEAAGAPEHMLSILGRSVEIGESGLPRRIVSHFSDDGTAIVEEGKDILAQPLALEVVVDGAPEVFEPGALTTSQGGRSRARWIVQSSSASFDLSVQGTLESDGMLDYKIQLTARREVAVDDIALPVAYAPAAAEYMLGLGRMGGKRPASFDWKWAVENHQEGVWLGATNRGLQYVLRDDNYVRPLNTNFYRDQPLNMPPSWFNDGRGGIRIREEDGTVVADNYSGPRTLGSGETLNLNVRFLITPFKPLDTRAHFNTRFVHQYVPVDDVVAWGGTVVNIHHANEINPYINYPFFNLEQQAAYIEEAHAKGVKVKLYNTIRELTYRAHELFAMRSLGDEIFNDGEGGGHSWLQEHLEGNYHSAWHAWRVDDAAILDKGTSRWTNYYIEGNRWLAANQHIDGLYLDDIAFSRDTVKRLAAVLHESRPEVVIDLHSANQFNERDGFTNSAMLYMEHFPYVSRLWFGEYFDYDQGPDYWMTEVAGIPFGLMGEMLQNGGHPYRGLLYGMTARKYGNVDPRPVWAMMNDFGIADSRITGYWLDDVPVHTDNPDVLATAYVRDDGALIVLGSWSDEDEVVNVTLDLETLGIAGPVRAWAPAVEGLQESAELDPAAVPVPAGQGLFVRLAPVSAGDIDGSSRP